MLCFLDQVIKRILTEAVFFLFLLLDKGFQNRTYFVIGEKFYRRIKVHAVFPVHMKVMFILYCSLLNAIALCLKKLMYVPLVKK